MYKELKEILPLDSQYIQKLHHYFLSFSQIAICMTAQVLGPANIFTEGLNWGISYELPNDSSEFREYFFPKKVMQRRHRRDLYQKMELIMNS